MDSNTDLEHQIQKCVDGELTQNEQRELFAVLDKNQDHSDWRTLALAFVEEQIWRREMRQLDIGLRPESGETMLMGPQLSSKMESDFPVTTSDSRTSPGRSSGHFPLTTILGLLIALTAGWLIGDIVQNNRFPAQSVARKTRARPANDPAIAETRPLLPAGTLPSNRTPENSLVSAPSMMEFDVTSGDQTSRMKVPVYSDVGAYREVLHQSRDAKTNEYYQRLRAQGMRLQTVRRALTIPMSNGNLAIVPFESLSVDRSQ